MLNPSRDMSAWCYRSTRLRLSNQQLCGVQAYLPQPGDLLVAASVLHVCQSVHSNDSVLKLPWSASSWSAVEGGVSGPPELGCETLKKLTNLLEV